MAKTRGGRKRSTAYVRQGDTVTKLLRQGDS